MVKSCKIAQIHENYLKLSESWRIVEFREKTSKRGKKVQIHRKCKNRRNFSKAVKMDKIRQKGGSEFLGYLYEIYTFDPLFWGS